MNWQFPPFTHGLLEHGVLPVTAETKQRMEQLFKVYGHRCPGLSRPAYSELRVTSPVILARSDQGLRSLACQALRDDVACCRCGCKSPVLLCYMIPLRDLFCYRLSAFSTSKPKTLFLYSFYFHNSWILCGNYDTQCQLSHIGPV